MLLAREAKKVHKSKAKVHQASRAKGHLASISNATPVESTVPLQLPALATTTNIIQQQTTDTTGKYDVLNEIIIGINREARAATENKQ